MTEDNDELSPGAVVHKVNKVELASRLTESVRQRYDIKAPSLDAVIRDCVKVITDEGVDFFGGGDPKKRVTGFGTNIDGKGFVTHIEIVIAEKDGGAELRTGTDALTRERMEEEHVKAMAVLHLEKPEALTIDSFKRATVLSGSDNYPDEWKEAVDEYDSCQSAVLLEYECESLLVRVLYAHRTQKFEQEQSAPAGVTLQ